MERFRRPAYSAALLVLMLTSQVIAVTPKSESSPKIDWPQSTSKDTSQAEQDLKNIVESLDLDEPPVLAEEQETADLITQRVLTTEWLGALAPVALSPFFGLTCLSGIAIMGEDRLPDDHFLKRASSPLANPLVFLTFLALTILTSLPKFSKVSKPFAQAVDQLETYSALIILLVIRVMGGFDFAPPGEEHVAVVYQASVFEFSAESLLMIATIINVIVINTVKFFFEVLIWITPVPFIDAIFEAGNKLLCAALAGIYAFSPTIATIINLLLLGACLLAFRWVKRREIYYRSILCDFLRNWFSIGVTPPAQAMLTVFPQQDIGGIPKMSRCELTPTENGWQLVCPRWFRPAIRKQFTGESPSIQPGLLMNSVSFEGTVFKFGKRYQKSLSQVAQQLDLRYTAPSANENTAVGLATELA